MKLNLIVVLAILFTIILAGCIQQQTKIEDQNANLTDNSKVIIGTDDTLKKDETDTSTMQNFEPVKLEIKYNKDEGLVNEIEIITNGFPESIKDYMKTITIAESIDENSALLNVIMLDSYKLIDSNKTDTCQEQSIIEKKKQYQSYSNGEIRAEGTENNISNIVLPKVEVSLSNGWGYNGLSYVTKSAEKFKVEGNEYNTLKITFGGTTNDIIVSGYYLFDYQNGRILKQYREEDYGSYSVIFTNIVTKIIKDTKAEEYKDCTNPFK
ncbi:MAG: hypothetical protein COT15_00335 [Candidatus Diapherotrites archaeon CG08_land_8_20_14_0_20_34_12]|nr:MAG: hypothetical protein COT15_00335 [Candidatus Diapherotrites archaeon CG08_land_8_20_14_0_20_34_12]